MVYYNLKWIDFDTMHEEETSLYNELMEISAWF